MNFYQLDNPYTALAVTVALWSLFWAMVNALITVIGGKHEK